MSKYQQPTMSRTGFSVAVFRILKALAKFTLRHGMSVGAMIELVRRAHLEAATELVGENSAKVTITRICAMTGMYRKEIRRLQQLPALSDQEADDKYNRSSRVVTGWIRDPDFNTSTGKPADLTMSGAGGFEALVRKYSGDMSPNAMLEELARLGNITLTSRGIIKLDAKAYLNSTIGDGVQILGTDTADLIETISHNLTTEESKFFQRKVVYVDIPETAAGEFLTLAEEESQKLLEMLDRHLSKVPDSEGEKHLRLGVGIYHFSKADNDDTESLLR